MSVKECGMNFLRFRAAQFFADLALVGGLVITMPIPPAHGQQSQPTKNPSALARVCADELKAGIAQKYHYIGGSRGYNVLTTNPKTDLFEPCRFDFEGNMTEGAAGRPSCSIGKRIAACLKQKLQS